MIIFYMLPIGVVIIIIALVSIRLSIRKRRQNIINKLGSLGTLSASNKASYDYDFLLEDISYKLKIIHIGYYQELSINSAKHWQVKPSKRIKLIPTDGFELLEEPKLLILYPHPGKLVKYINENEIVFLKPNEKCFDFYLYTDKQLNNINPQ